MDATDRFLRFAAECEIMAKSTRRPEDKAVWNGLAQRWVRCAELIEQEHLHRQPPPRQHRTVARHVAH